MTNEQISEKLNWLEPVAATTDGSTSIVHEYKRTLTELRDTRATLAGLVSLTHAPNPTNPKERRIKPGCGAQFSVLVCQIEADLQDQGAS